MFSIISAILQMIMPTIDKVVESSEEKAKLKAEIQNALINMKSSEMQAAMNIIMAEANGDSWMQRNWRPILMMSITVIVINNYIISPYVQAFFGVSVYLELPPELFNLMTIGVGGYVVGRSFEKVTKHGSKAYFEHKVDSINSIPRPSGNVRDFNE